MSEIWNAIIGATFTNQMGLLLYWAPVLCCAFYYTIYSYKMYRVDFKKREEARIDGGNIYYPKETIGSLVKRFIITFTPVVNIIATGFVVLPDVFSFLDEFFNIPLVPKAKK